MTNYISRWLSKLATPSQRSSINYESQLTFESESVPGVEFSIRRMSFLQHLDLTGRLRQLVLKNEFLAAGELTDQLEAKMANALVQKLYIEWALADLAGLSIDNEPATIERLLEKGPLELINEISKVIRSETELSEPERKNF